MTDKIVAQVWIDPPSGWRYGFPKKIMRGYTPSDAKALFRASGIPERDWDFSLRHCRMWPDDDEIHTKVLESRTKEGKKPC